MTKYRRYDNCYGTIIDKCLSGVYVLLDNNEIAFANDFTTYPKGTKVLCSVLKEANRFLRTLVSIDANLSEYECVA